jgi:large subunit ribosomal protein L15
MSFKLNEIRDNKGALAVRKVVGRGIGSGLGKTCGRGGKGQTARAGVSLNGFEGGQMPIYRRVPKRGFKSNKVGLFELHFDKLKHLISSGKILEKQVVDANLLVLLRLMPKVHTGISLISKGSINIPLTFQVAKVSKKAKELVEAAGGSVLVE